MGQIVGGTKHNIIPASAVMRGSLRTFDEAVRAQIKRRLAEFAAGIATAYRAGLAVVRNALGAAGA